MKENFKPVHRGEHNIPKEIICSWRCCSCFCNIMPSFCKIGTCITNCCCINFCDKACYHSSDRFCQVDNSCFSRNDTTACNTGSLR